MSWNNDSWNNDVWNGRQDEFYSQNTDAYWNQNAGSPINAQAQEYKQNSKFLLRVAILCGAVIAIAVLFTVLYIQLTRNVMMQKIKELDYVTQTHASNELLTVNNSEVIVSDVLIFSNSTEAWMPYDKMLVGVYIEADGGDTYVYGSGIDEPYLKYGEGYYTYPVTDQKLKSLLVKMGLSDEDFLSNYGIGSYGKDAGYLFFLVDEKAEDFAFVIEEHESTKGRMEFLRVRHLIQLELKGYYEE